MSVEHVSAPSCNSGPQSRRPMVGRRRYALVGSGSAQLIGGNRLAPELATNSALSVTRNKEWARA